MFSDRQLSEFRTMLRSGRWPVPGAYDAMPSNLSRTGSTCDQAESMQGTMALLQACEQMFKAGEIDSSTYETISRAINSQAPNAAMSDNREVDVNKDNEPAMPPKFPGRPVPGKGPPAQDSTCPGGHIAQDRSYDAHPQPVDWQPRPNKAAATRLEQAARRSAQRDQGGASFASAYPGAMKIQT